MRKLLGIIAIALLAGCGINGPTDRNATISRVHIREKGKVVTTYELGGDGKMLSSSTADRRGNAFTRKYYYGSGDELAAVTRNSPNRGEEIVQIFDETDRDKGGRIARTIKTVDGSAAIFQYVYGADGALVGILSKDAGGNLQAKGADDQAAAK